MPMHAAHKFLQVWYMIGNIIFIIGPYNKLPLLSFVFLRQQSAYIHQGKKFFSSNSDKSLSTPRYLQKTHQSLFPLITLLTFWYLRSLLVLKIKLNRRNRRIRRIPFFSVCESSFDDATCDICYLRFCINTVLTVHVE